MPCPTCDHTLQNVGLQPRRVFWCPRCGTLVEESGDWKNVEAPRWTRLSVDAEQHQLAAELLELCQRRGWQARVTMPPKE